VEPLQSLVRWQRQVPTGPMSQGTTFALVYSFAAISVMALYRLRDCAASEVFRTRAGSKTRSQCFHAVHRAEIPSRAATSVSSASAALTRAAKCALACPQMAAKGASISSGSPRCSLGIGSRGACNASTAATQTISRSGSRSMQLAVSVAANASAALVEIRGDVLCWSFGFTAVFLSRGVVHKATLKP